METIEKFAKKCDCCGKGMNLGYVDCESTYCSDRCLVWGNSPHSTLNTDEFIPYHPSEWASDHEIFPNSCYYTEWEELEEDEYYLADGTIVTTDEQVNKFKKLN